MSRVSERVILTKVGDVITVTVAEGMWTVHSVTDVVMSEGVGSATVGTRIEGCI